MIDGSKDQGLKIHFNKKLPEEYFKQLTAETCYVEHNDFGRPKHKWIKDKYFANEALDCAVGNLAAFEIEGYNRWNDHHWDLEMKKCSSIKTVTSETKSKGISMI